MKDTVLKFMTIFLLIATFLLLNIENNIFFRISSIIRFGRKKTLIVKKVCKVSIPFSVIDYEGVFAFEELGEATLAK